MITKKPTNKQIGEFWKWCGFTSEDLIVNDYHYKQEHLLIYPDGTKERVYKRNYPEIDLNNLFKYAVLKMNMVTLDFQEQNYMYWVKLKGDSSIQNDKDPVLALFWAIWEVIHANK